jgi:hypothetical protein
MIASNLEQIWSQVEVHPAADLFPMMSPEEYEGLRDDIHQHGQREKIVLWQGLLIDGRNRLRACIELGIEPEHIALPEDADPVAFVCSLNVHRRHLNTSQRASIAARLCSIPRGGDRRSDDFKVQICTSIDEASDLMNVSPRTTKTAKKVQEKAKPEVVKKVEAGKMSVNAAAKTIDPKPKYEVRTDPLSAIKKQISDLEDGPAYELYRWQRSQMASAEAEGYVTENGPELTADDIELLGSLVESENTLGIMWHLIRAIEPAKLGVVRDFISDMEEEE